MHSRLPKVGTAVGVVAGLIASSLVMTPMATAAEEETAGNNLAFPVLWSEDGYVLTTPGTMGETLITGIEQPCSEDTSVSAALQKDLGNSWQADNMLMPGNSVSSLDWGDNIEVKDWTVGPPVRIETALYADLGEDTMTGYEMCHVSGKGTDEVWGARIATGGGSEMTTEAGSESPATEEPATEEPATEEPATEEPATEEPATEEPATEEPAKEEPQEALAPGDSSKSLIEYESTEAMVYTAGARLTIQRIDADANPTWDATQRRWVGPGVADPVFNGAVHEKTSDGPGSYGAEINVSGKVVFGFNWQTDGLFNGEYRITFSLDGPVGDFPGTGTSLASAEIRQSVEETAGDELAIRSAPMAGHGGGMGGGGMGGGGHGGGGGGDEGGEGGGNVAEIVGAQNLSFIDVGLSGGENPPVDPDPEPTTPPAPPSGGGGADTPPADSGGAVAGGGALGAGGPATGQPGAGVPVEVASPILAQQRIKQRARITAPKSSKQRVRTRLMLTEGPIFTDQGVTVRWRVTKRSQDNCTIRNRSGEVSVAFTNPGRCTVVAWAPSPNPLVFAPFVEKRVYQVRNNV